jgi:hypothetical protein
MPGSSDAISSLFPDRFFDSLPYKTFSVDAVLTVGTVFALTSHPGIGSIAGNRKKDFDNAVKDLASHS